MRVFILKNSITRSLPAIRHGGQLVLFMLFLSLFVLCSEQKSRGPNKLSSRQEGRQGVWLRRRHVNRQLWLRGGQTSDNEVNLDNVEADFLAAMKAAADLAPSPALRMAKSNPGSKEQTAGDDSDVEEIEDDGDKGNAASDVENIEDDWAAAEAALADAGAAQATGGASSLSRRADPGLSADSDVEEISGGSNADDWQANLENNAIEDIEHKWGGPEESLAGAGAAQATAAASTAGSRDAPSLSKGAADEAKPSRSILNSALGISSTADGDTNDEELGPPPTPRPPPDLPTEPELPVGSDGEIPSSFFETLLAVDQPSTRGSASHNTSSAGAAGVLNGEDADESEDVDGMNGAPGAGFSANFLANSHGHASESKRSLWEAAQSESPDARKLMRQAILNGASVNSHDASMYHWTPLHMASERGLKANVEALIELGANVSSRSENGHTALHVAVLHLHKHIVESLLEHGADVNALTQALYSPLHIAASTGSVQMMHELLDWGAHEAQETYVGNTALHLAATQGHQHMAENLIKCGLKTNARNHNGMTALHMAVLMNRIEVLKVLVENDADVNVSSTDGNTAMHFAAVRGHIDSIEYLADNTAYNYSLVNAGNMTALDAAIQAGEGLCATVLWRKMGKPGRRLEISAKPKTEEEEDKEFLQLLWDTYCEHRTEEHLPGVKKCDDIVDQLNAVKRLNGMPTAQDIKPEDDFVVRKGVRVYLKDSEKKKRPRLLMYDRGDS